MRKAPPIAFALFGLIVFGQSSAEERATRLKREIQQYPNHSLAHYQLGEIYLDKQDYQTAANEYSEALNGDLQPAWIGRRSHMILAWIFGLNGRTERSQSEYRLAGEAAKTNDPGSDTDSREFLAARPIRRTAPEYTEEARVAEIEGDVLIEAIIDPNGEPREMIVIRSLGLGLDERAMEAVKSSRFEPARFRGSPVASFIEPSVPFRLPSGQSRWHLVKAEFQPSTGATPPHFKKTKFPLGAGIGYDAIDEGRIVGALGRQAHVRLAFVVDERGIPTHFEVRESSYNSWGPAAERVVREWEFLPGTKNGTPIPVTAVVDLVWGPQRLP